MRAPFLLSMVLAAAGAASCGGKVIVDGSATEGTGGAGGAGTTSSHASSSSSHASTSASAVSSTGSGPSCNPMETCAEAITPPQGNPATLCDPAKSLYQTLLQCLCGGKCAPACSANTCIGQSITLNCQNCVMDPVKGCGKEFTACANN